MTSRERRLQTDPLGLAGTALLERYRVETAIAQGGMGVVYRGHDLRLLRPVCIKIFHRLSPSDMAYRTSYEHFVQEAFALSQLSHPHTLRIYDFGHLEDDSEAPFHVSELLEGGTLSQLVRREGPRTPAEALEILEPVAGALAEAHARGIIHRDIKPSNIIFALVGTRRVAKLADFGIAKAHADGACMPMRAGDTALSSGQAMRLYSPGWAAPEQIRAEPPGPVTDVFSLGLVTAFVLGGRPIFSSSRDEAAFEERNDSDAHVERALDDLRLPDELADVVRCACRDATFERYPSAEAFALALRAAVAAVVRREDLISTAPLRPVAAVESQPVVATPVAAPRAATPVPAPAPVAAPAVAVTGPASTLSQPAPTLVVDTTTGDGEVVVAGRRLRLLGMAGKDQLDLGGDSAALRSPARVRITLLPSSGPLPRVNVKGLNCFVARAGSRPAAAVDVEGDVDLELYAPDRRKLDGVRCTLGRSGGSSHLYDLGSVTLSVPANEPASVLLDFGPGRELALLHRGPAVLPGGRR